MLGMTQKEKYENLTLAIGRGDVAGVSKALDRGASPNRPASQANGGPLVDALALRSEENSVAIVSALLARGAEVYKKDSDGETVLHYFGRTGGDHLAVLGKLLEAGADATALYKGMTPLCNAVKNKFWLSAEALLAAKPDQPRPVVNQETLLMWAVRDGAPLTLLDKLQEAPIDLNARADIGSALHLAVAARRQDALRWLLARPGIEVNIADGEGRTPLLLAVAGADKEIASVLLAAGADPNFADKKGGTPLLAAVQAGRQDLVELLLGSGAAPGQPDNAGNLPLGVAVEKGADALVGILLVALDAGHAKLDLQPALVTAAEKGHSGILEMLIAAGAEVNAADAGGRTPLMKAALADQLGALKVLVAAGAKTEMEDAQGLGAYDHAVSGGRIQSREFLKTFRREPAAGDKEKRASSKNRGAAANDDRYTRLSDHSIEVREGPNLAVIFNFWMGQVIYRDPSQPAPVVVQSFAEVPRPEAINEAFQELRKRGGTPPEPFTASLQKRPAGLGKA